MKNVYLIVYDNYNSITKEFKEQDQIFGATVFDTWNLARYAMLKISKLYDKEQIFEFDFDDKNQLFSLKVHVMYGYDLHFRVCKLIFQKDLEELGLDENEKPNTTI